MSISKLLERLEAIIDFRISEGASKTHPIVLRGNNSCPANDGTQIFLPRRASHFESDKNNDLFVSDSVAHESDHLKEIGEYFGAETETLRAAGVNLVQEFLARNYSGLEKNPALAAWIDNVVKDRRIDYQRREQLPGVERHFREVLAPAAEYLRPSIRGMSALDS